MHCVGRVILIGPRKAPLPGRKCSGKALREQVKTLLQADDFRERLAEWDHYPGRQVINPLFSFLYSTNQQLKWRAVAAIGRVVARLADEERESARVVMRRLVWNLNDESGGIGWGAPEAMGEIMACHEGLASEYGHILVSYISPEGNPLEHEELQCGVLWGLGRMARSWPHLLWDAVPHILPYLAAGNKQLQGLAAWILGALPNPSTDAALWALLRDTSEVVIHSEGKELAFRICDLAAQALAVKI
jgi:hypothetical protein